MTPLLNELDEHDEITLIAIMRIVKQINKRLDDYERHTETQFDMLHSLIDTDQMDIQSIWRYLENFLPPYND